MPLRRKLSLACARNPNTIRDGPACCLFTILTELAWQQELNELWVGEKDAKKLVFYPTSYSEVRNKAYYIRVRGYVILLEKMLVHHSNSRQSIIFSHIQLHATFCYFLLWRKLLLCLRVNTIHPSLPWTDVCWVHNNTKPDSYNHSLSKISEYCFIIKDSYLFLLEESLYISFSDVFYHLQLLGLWKSFSEVPYTYSKNTQF
jgi:hypothetical protein